MRARLERVAARLGFSLIEVIVTLTVLSIALVGLVPVSRRVAGLSNQSTGRTQRLAALSGEIQRIEALPFDSLVPGRTCHEAASGAPYAVCVSVAVENGRTRTITLYLTPHDRETPPDTAVLERSQSTGGHPLALP